MRTSLAIILIVSSVAMADDKPPNTYILDSGSAYYTGLVGCWPIWETSGSTIDDVTTTNANGTLQADANFVAGNFNASGAVHLNGTDEFVACGTAAALGLTTAGTVLSWVKPDTTPNSYGIIAGKGDYANDSNGYWLFGRASGANMAFYMEIASGAAHTTTNISTARCVPGQWTQVVGRWNASVLILDVNGAIDQNTAAVVVPEVDSPAVQFYIGDAPTYSSFFKGTIDHIFVWNRMLTDEEVASLYTTQFPMFKAGATTPFAAYRRRE